MQKIDEPTLGRKPEQEVPLTAQAVEQELRTRADALTKLVRDQGTAATSPTFKAFENCLQEALFAVGRSALAWFLALRETQVARTYGSAASIECEGRRFRRAPPITRSLGTLFGVVRYSRTYMRECSQVRRRGFHPLDVELGLVADRFSWNVLTKATRLATKVSFAEARATLATFIPATPSTEVIEQAVLGLGGHTANWFSHAPVPEGDGDVLVIMIDSKGAPTATESELRRRRGKRRRRRFPASKRHRGRHHRRRYETKPRRQKGDHSKNARLATMVLMYTLKRHGSKLLGPINRWQYASFAPKRHAFEIARREANKRGFGPGVAKQIQLVTDGDLNLATYAAEVFPDALHTIDVMHVIEKLWMAGESFYPEASQELRDWIRAQKRDLYAGRIDLILARLRRRRAALPRHRPGAAGRLDRLGQAIRYLDQRINQMPYGMLVASDLELGTGSVEGAIKNIIGKRCDHGGMRWIKERVEAVVQLRCIEANGHWDAFTDFVHQRLQALTRHDGLRRRLQTAIAAELPALAA